MAESIIKKRKREHLRIVAEDDVLFDNSTLFRNIELIHDALPELASSDIDTSTGFFGKNLNYPLMITSMTGGADYAKKMNRSLAAIAAEKNIAFAVGSQRIMIKYPEVLEDFAVRKYIPDGVLLGNIGGVQLKEYSSEAIADLADRIEADGICVHLNPAQELVQGEDHCDFTGILDGIAHLNDKMDGRVLVKETGSGLGPSVLKRLKSIGVSYIDVAGAGGTSWTKVEMHRAPTENLRQLGITLKNWGLPSAFCVVAASRIFGEDAKIIASGGIRDGMDAAKALAIGADVAGFAREILLKFLAEGENGARDFLDQMIAEIKAIMLLTGSSNLENFKKTKVVYSGKLREYLDSFGLSAGESIG